ncbi:MAG: hypothetical protein HY929_00155 [Euryarchaeota archaeon]|nr:hypothetical protein [Euryarchaeota archaeon]
MNKSGSISLEALLAFAILFALIATFAQLISERMSSASDLGLAGEAKMVGEKVATLIDTVYANGPGFQINTTLPDNLGTNYIINISSQKLRVKILTSYTGTSYITANISFIPKNVVVVPTSLGNNATFKNEGPLSNPVIKIYTSKIS